MTQISKTLKNKQIVFIFHMREIESIKIDLAL